MPLNMDLSGRCALVTGAASGRKRLLEPAEVASYIAFLCSEAASGIPGATQVIDCGWTAR